MHRSQTTAKESSNGKGHEIASPPPSARKNGTHPGVGDKKVGGFAANFFIPPYEQSYVLAMEPEVRGRLKQSHPQPSNLVSIRGRLKQSRPHQKENVLFILGK